MNNNNHLKEYQTSPGVSLSTNEFKVPEGPSLPSYGSGIIPATPLEPWVAPHPVPHVPKLPAAPSPWGGLPPNPLGPWNPAPFAPAPLNPPCIPGPFGPVGMPLVGYPETLLPARKAEDEVLYQRIAKAIAEIPKRSQKKEIKRTHIILLLDTSGSMLKAKDVAISGFNEQVDTIKSQKKGAGRTTISLILFNTVVSVPYEYKNTKALVKLTDETYSPWGMTALYDAMGVAMEKIIDAKGFKEKNTAFFVSVQTDGRENQSSRCYGELVSKCMSMLQDTGRVTFSFMGPERDLKSIADVLRMAPGNMAGFNPQSMESCTQAFAAMTSATRSYLNARTEGLTSVCNLYTGADRC